MRAVTSSIPSLSQSGAVRGIDGEGGARRGLRSVARKWTFASALEMTSAATQRAPLASLASSQAAPVSSAIERTPTCARRLTGAHPGAIPRRGRRDDLRRRQRSTGDPTIERELARLDDGGGGIDLRLAARRRDERDGILRPVPIDVADQAEHERPIRRRDELEPVERPAEGVGRGRRRVARAKRARVVRRRRRRSPGAGAPERRGPGLVVNRVRDVRVVVPTPMAAGAAGEREREREREREPRPREERAPTVRHHRARYTTTGARAASAWTRVGIDGSVRRVVRTLLALAFVIVSLVSLTAPAIAIAQEAAREDGGAANDPAAPANALFQLAEAEDAAGDYAHAAPHYRAAVAELPSSRYAEASTRAALLEAHAEGDWLPYAKLEAVRHDPKAARDNAAIEPSPPPPTPSPPARRAPRPTCCAPRPTSRVWPPARRRGALERSPAIRTPTASSAARPRTSNHGAHRRRRSLRRPRGRRRARPDARRGDGQRVSELIRRRRVHFGAIAVLTLFVLFAAIAIARAAARGALGRVGGALRKTLPLGLAFAAYIALVGAWLASGYEAGNAEPFLAFGAGEVPDGRRRFSLSIVDDLAGHVRPDGRRRRRPV